MSAPEKTSVLGLERLQNRIAELEASVERHRTLFDQAGYSVFYHLTDGQIVDVNEEACRSLGYSREELLSLKAGDIEVHWSDEELKESAQALVSGSVKTLDGVQRRKDGSTFPVEVRVNLIQQTDCDLVQVIARDITERNAAEEALRDSEDRWRSLTESSPYYVMLLDLDLRIVFINRTVPELTRDQVIGRSHLDFLPPDQHQVGIDCFERVARSRQHDAYEVRYLDANEEVHFFDVRVAPRLGQDGKVIGFVSSSFDISERRRSEVRLAESESLLASAQRLAHMGSWDWDLQTDNILWSDEMYGIYGIDRGTEDLNASSLERVHPDDRPAVLSVFEGLQKGDAAPRIEYRVVLPEGEERHVLSMARAVRDQSGKIVRLTGTVQDVTHQRQEEAAQERAEREWTGAMDVFEDIVYLLDDDRRVLRANAAFYKLTGKTHDAVVGLHIAELLHPNGEVVPCPVCLAQEEKRDLDLIMEADHPDNPTGRPLEITVRIIRDEGGEPQGIVMVLHDLSEVRMVENERLTLERQVQQAQKLESLGVLAGGIAHDFNNILTAILGNADLALDQISPVSPARSYIQQIELASKRAAGLAQQMLAYSGRGRFVIEAIDLGEFVTEMVHLLEVAISKKAVLSFNFADNLPLIDGDASQIRQVIMNLITNASEAIGDRSGLIALSTGAMHCDRVYLNTAATEVSMGRNEPLPEGIYSYVEVADTGCGMDAETLVRIFEPFFTTKFTGRGLGMAAALGIVRGHKGAIKLYSEPGTGTTIKVLFPAKDLPENENDEGTGEKKEGGSVRWTGQGTVLLVDDEESVRAVGQQMLTRMGFDVLTASDGIAGVQMFNEHRDEIVCILLDLTMPHADGEQAFHELRRISPEVKVILCSGYNMQAATQRFVGKGLAGFIQKPYALKVLRTKLMEILE